MAEKKYRITLNEKQMYVLKDICELRFRIDLCQEYDLAEILATMDCLDLSPENPRHKEIFDSYIERREHISVILKALFEIASPYATRVCSGRKRNPDALCAEDIWQVIRKQLYDDKPASEKLRWDVDSKDPLRVSEQPLPVIEKLE